MTIQYPYNSRQSLSHITQPILGCQSRHFIFYPTLSKLRHFPIYSWMFHIISLNIWSVHVTAPWPAVMRGSEYNRIGCRDCSETGNQPSRYAHTHTCRWYKEFANSSHQSTACECLAGCGTRCGSSNSSILKHLGESSKE